MIPMFLFVKVMSTLDTLVEPATLQRLAFGLVTRTMSQKSSSLKSSTDPSMIPDPSLSSPQVHLLLLRPHSLGQRRSGTWPLPP